MNKTVLLTAVPATVATTSTSTVILTSNSEGYIAEESQNNITNQPLKEGDHKEYVWNDKLIKKLQSAQDIKSQYKNIDCLKNYYAGSEDWQEAAQKDSSPQLDLSQADSNNVDGCLTFEYHRSTYNHKWKWNFSLIWTWKHEDDGMVVVFNSKTDERKLSVDSVAYTLKKKNSKWTIKYQQISSVKEITNAHDVTSKFPEVGKIGSGLRDENYWGLDLSLDKICTSDSCKEDSNPSHHQSSKTWKWIPVTEGTKIYKIYEWNKNFSTWFNNLFPNWSNIKDQLEKFTGQWI